jgi:hypothetical protein
MEKKMTVNYERKKIYAHHGYLDLDGLDKEQSFKTLNEFWERFPEEGAYLIMAYNDNGDKNGYYTLRIPRLENEKEYANRIKKEEKWEEDKLASQKKEYEELKKIFEKDGNK